MNVVYSSSDAYSELAGISMVSLFENNKDASEINVYIIDNGIAEQNIARLEEIAAQYSRKLIFLKKIDIESMSGTKINVGRWHLSTFFRLFLSSILPKDIDRVMYIDCDMIIRHSLDPVWSMDMQGRYAMAADDCRGWRYRSELGLPSDQIYVNNGFLLIDLKAWRESNVEQKFLDFILKRQGDVTYMDQGVLNGVLGPLGLVGLLPLKYNAQTVFYDFNHEEIKLYRNPVYVYSHEDMSRDLSDPVIVHFTSCFISGTRPWNTENDHTYRDEFLKYKAMTPWRDTPLWEDTRKLKSKMMTKVCRALPKKPMLTFVSLLHTTLYPMMRMAKRNRAMRKASATVSTVS